MQIQAVFPGRIAEYPPEVASILEQIPSQGGRLSPEQVDTLLSTTEPGIDDLMKSLLPLASALSVAPISHFHVGAVVEGASGSLYLGANLELANQPLKVTVHAEQSAVCNAWHQGEPALRRLVVNEAPCGHCRQFLNELNGAEQLQVIVDRQPPKGARTYKMTELLPDAFGPADLGLKERLMHGERHKLMLSKEALGDPLAQAALEAASNSYAPVCKCYAGVALKLSSGHIVTGRYGANAAFNPGITAMESAIVNWRLKLLQDPHEQVVDAVLVEQLGVSSQKDVTASFLAGYGIELRYYKVQAA